MKLDLGAGKKPREGFRAVDVCEGSDVVMDLACGMRWPFEDGSASELHSSHFIEHIPAEMVLDYRDLEKWRDALFFFFDECFRITRPGAVFTLIWPSLKSSDAFRDPTHRRFLPLEFLHYLSREGRKAMGVEHYNVFCDWIVKDAKLTFAKPEGDEPWSTFERETLWDVQKAWTVTLERGE